ncbi:MAG: hypothetical protein AB4080_00585 [Trichodesmium sp.]
MGIMVSAWAIKSSDMETRRQVNTGIMVSVWATKSSGSYAIPKIYS